MRNGITMTAILIALSSFTLAQDVKSPHAGQEKREIKSLSIEEIQGYLSGKGMGLAKSAELNHYPGPRHVLDMAEELPLSKEQLVETREIYNRMHKEAVRFGKLLLEKERILNSLFAEQKMDEKQLRSLVTEIARVKGELRFVHLKAHLEMKQVLSPKQIEKYDELRGYKASSGSNSHRKAPHDQH